MSISGNSLIVGGWDALQPVSDPATAYVFVRDGASWSLQAKLTPGTGIADGTHQVVSISGDLAIVGETTGNFSNTYQGKAYIFRRTGTQWEKQPALEATPAPNTRFGWSVAIGPHYALVGDPWGAKGGAVYVFGYNGTQLAKIHASDLVSDDFFGQPTMLFHDLRRTSARKGGMLQEAGGRLTQGTKSKVTRSRGKVVSLAR